MEKVEGVRLTQVAPGTWELRIDVSRGGASQVIRIGDDVPAVAYQLEVLAKRLVRGVVERST
jgi:hypothetical protein